MMPNKYVVFAVCLSLAVLIMIIGWEVPIIGSFLIGWAAGDIAFRLVGKLFFSEEF